MEVFCLNVISDSIIHWFFSDEASITKPTFFQEIHPPPHFETITCLIFVIFYDL